MDDPIPRPVREAGGRLLDALLDLTAEREDVRRALTTVNAWLARELSRRAASATSAARATGPAQSGQAAPSAATPNAATPSAAPPRRDSDLPEGGPAPRREDGGTEFLVPRSSDVLVPRALVPPVEEVRPVDLVRVQARATWKGEALRLAVERRKAGAAPGAELRTREADLRQRQSAVGTPWAWMLDAPPARVETEALTRLAQCYELVAAVAAGLLRIEGSESVDVAPPVDLLRVVAEAQSALLAALGSVGLRQDEDQRDLFQWLRERTTRHRIYVDRHMRLEDPADPALAVELRARFDEWVERTVRLGAGRRHRMQLLNKVRFHVRKLRDGGVGLEGEWHSLGGALIRWREHELDLADRQLVEVLEALAGHDLPASLGAEPTHEQALEALRHALGHADLGDVARASALGEARRLLESRRALMLADSADPAAQAALVEAFGLARLDWLELDVRDLAPAVGEAAAVAEAPPAAEPPAFEVGEGAPGSAQERAPQSPPPAPPTADLAAAIRRERIHGALGASRPEVVFMGLRLPQDEYQAFKDRCVELQLPFVRLPGVLTPASVAHQTLRQVGWRLRDSKVAPTS